MTLPLPPARRALQRCLALVAVVLGVAPLATARGQDLNQLDGQFQAASSSGRLVEAEQLAGQAAAIARSLRDAQSAAFWDVRRGETLIALGHYADAVDPIRRSLAFYERSTGKTSQNNILVCLRDLGRVYVRMGLFVQAEPLLKRALEIKQQMVGRDHPGLAEYLEMVAETTEGLGRPDEAETLMRRALAVYQNQPRPNPRNLAAIHQGLAILALGRARYDECDAWIKQALTVAEQSNDPESLADALNVLGNLDDERGRFAEAEATLTRALAIQEKGPNADHPEIAITLNNLAGVYRHQGRYADAEPLLRRVVAISEKYSEPDSPYLGTSLMNLATIAGALGRTAEEEALDQRALAIFEKAGGARDAKVAMALNNLGGLNQKFGRLADAESYFKRALAIREALVGPDHPEVASTLNNLAVTEADQRRFDDAEAHLRRSLAIDEKTFGPDHPEVAAVLSNLAGLYNQQDRYKDAEDLLRRSLGIFEKAGAAGHQSAAECLIKLANADAGRGRTAEAEAGLRRALQILEKALGPDHPDSAGCLFSLAHLLAGLGRDEEAESLLDRSIANSERASAHPSLQFSSYSLRAALAWKAGRRSEAIADQRHALDLAEQQRLMTSGAEFERARSFGGFLKGFEQMVAWQSELGDASEVFAAIERAHARSFLDEVATAGADLDAGRPAAELDRLRQAEAECNSKVTEAEFRRDRLLKTKAADSEEVKAAEAEIAKARKDLYNFCRDRRGSSPVYRGLISAGNGPPTLGQFQRRLSKGGMALIYLFGERAGYVLWVGLGPAKVAVLTLPEPEAKTLGVEAGPLTARKLRAALLGADGRDGVVPRLGDRERSETVAPKLEALWRVLVPEPCRLALCDGTAQSLVVIPDAELALLPFEPLVVEAGLEPRYLLDAGPPIAYCPSATVFQHLKARAASPRQAGREPLLTLGDPAYPAADATGPTAGSVSRFRAAGGRLARLPFTAWETAWVAKAFADRGGKARILAGADATESHLRATASGRRVVHLACHGLVDQTYGNLFGALALAPGPAGAADPSDDGLLTLREVYGLDLKGCELTILSACQTNFGPRQDGEGTWTLSRGFLVAGARRVVASDWLVDDEAGASLISVFSARCRAMSEDAAPADDFARSLQDAKRWTRNQAKWKAPYYWASLVLIGPL